MITFLLMHTPSRSQFVTIPKAKAPKKMMHLVLVVESLLVWMFEYYLGEWVTEKIGRERRREKRNKKSWVRSWKEETRRKREKAAERTRKTKGKGELKVQKARTEIIMLNSMNKVERGKWQNADSHWELNPTWLQPPVLSLLSYNNQVTISTSQSSIHCRSGTEYFSHTPSSHYVRPIRTH